MSQHLPIAKVVLDVALPHLDYPFDYLVPEDIDELCQPGVKVKVKFAGRNLDGWIVERSKTNIESKKLARIDKVISDIPVLKAEIVEVCRITADRFIGTLNDCLRFSVPPRQAKIEKSYANKEINRQINSKYKSSKLKSKISAVEFPPNFEYLEYLFEIITEVRDANKQTIFVVPNINDVNILLDFIKKTDLKYRILSAEQEASLRYQSFLDIQTYEIDLVIGTRNAVFAPVTDLGLIILWDDSEENFYSPQAPYWNVREVSQIRRNLNDCYLLFAGFGKSIKTFLDVKNNKIDALTIENFSDYWPAIYWNSSDDPIEKTKSIPSFAWKMIQEGLKSSNVLIQVPRLGYSSNLQCLECRESLKCKNCSGPLHKTNKDSALECKWCVKVETFWQCPYCRSTKYLTSVSGQKKIVEEIGKAFPGVKIITSGGKNILRKVNNENAIVVATPGAEPVCEDKYSSLVIIDSFLYLSRAGLSTNEDNYRKWINAISLVKNEKNGGKFFINLEGTNKILQSLIKKLSDWYLSSELEIREQTNLYPISDTYVLNGLINEINEINTEISKIQGLTLLGPSLNDKDETARLVVSTTKESYFPVELRAMINKMSLKKRNPVRVKLNPYDIE